MFYKFIICAGLNNRLEVTQRLAGIGEAFLLSKDRFFDYGKVTGNNNAERPFEFPEYANKY